MSTASHRCLQTQDVQLALASTVKFLQPYLQLANSHATNFIIDNHWSTLLEKNIQQELINLSDEELLALPFSAAVEDCTPITKVKIKSNELCHMKDQLSCSGNETNGESNLKTSECHSSQLCLRKFIRDAWDHTLAGQGMYILPDTLLTDLNIVDSFDKSTVFIGEFMNQKKSHEVQQMSSICSMLARATHTNLIVDVGSGKGYLGNHLSLQYGHCVMGVDAVRSYTESAERRMTLLQRQWDGLTRQAVQDQRLTKKQKKQLKEAAKASTAISYKNAEMGGSSVGVHVAGESVGNYCGVSNKHNNDDYCATRRQEQDLQDSFATSTDKNKQLKNTQILDEVMSKLQLVECKTCNMDKRRCICKRDQSRKEMGDVDSQLCGLKRKPMKDVNEVCESKITPRYIPLTLFIDKKTDFYSLTKSYFPELYLSIPKNLQTVDISNTRVYTSSDIVESEEDYPSIAVKEKQINFCDKPAQKEHELVQKIQLVADHSNIADSVCRDHTSLKLMLTGLHTCGDLATDSLELFVSTSDMQTVCNVGCCYHLLTEEFLAEKHLSGKDPSRSATDVYGFPKSQFLKKQGVMLGTCTRNLACQAVHRMPHTQTLQGERFFARALLEVLVKEVCQAGSVTWRSLRNLEQRTASTHNYIRQACLKLDISEQVSDSTIDEYIARYSGERRRLAAFVQLRAVLAPVIESLILLDRALYLLEHEHVSQVYLVQMFDPVISPRCYGLIASK